jgi:serine phosphatase RsbU (regulator of sigma subunit)
MADVEVDGFGPALQQRLVQAARMAPPDALAETVADVLSEAGGHDTVVYVVDYGQRFLVPLPPGPGGPVDVDDSHAGEVFRSMRPAVAPGAHGERVRIPLVDGVERLGVLEVTAPTGTGQEAQALENLVAFGSTVAELLTTKGQYGDAIARTARTRPMSLAAEIQWQALPPLTFATEGVVVAGTIEPCYAVGGDTFDYSASRSSIRFAVMDAMGHGLQASLLSTTAVAAYRNARRADLGLEDSVRHMDTAVAEAFPGGAYVTAVVAELDLAGGVLRWVLAGHPAPLVLHEGRVDRRLTLDAAPPLGLWGMDEGTGPTVGETRLRPGDGVLAFTDGVVEARDARGNFFGVDRLVDIVGRTAVTDIPAPEVLRQVTLEVLRHQSGPAQDDATQIFVEWRSGREARLSPRRAPASQ